MTIHLPKTTAELMSLTWADFEAMYTDVENQPVSAGNIDQWLASWSRVSECVDEQYQRLIVATSVNTVDETADKKYAEFLDNVYPNAQSHEQKLKEKLLATGLEPKGFDVPLRNMRSDTKIFREENLPLLSEEQKLSSEFDKIFGAQTVDYNGTETTVYGLSPYLQSPDRSVREKAWLLEMNRQYADRDAINALWVKFMELRLKIAKNADQKDYRDYKWKQYYRFDYTPDDCLSFHAAIESVVVPAVTKLLKRHGEKMGVPILKPWDIDIKNYVDPVDRPSLRPFKTSEEQIEKTKGIFNNIDPKLGEFFRVIVEEGLIDLPNRIHKAPGAYCTGYNLIRKPFVFCNSVGTHNDVSTLVHESGHAFHVFESAKLPYMAQLNVTMEFAEVASMGMEFLASPFYHEKFGGFYNDKDNARAEIEHHITSLMFWPYMSVVDSFQHWVYQNPQKAMDPNNCDQEWGLLWDRFMPDQDWAGFDHFKKTGWHRKIHIHQVPFYYIEYGLAQLGAAQIWANSKKDQPKAVANYRHALSLGATATLPKLFEAAGAKLAFDVETLKTNVDLMMERIDSLEQI